MRESSVRAKHERDCRQAFQDAGCRFFPNSQVVMHFNGPRFFEELNKTAHTTFDYKLCDCKKLITVTAAEEWAAIPVTND